MIAVNSKADCQAWNLKLLAYPRRYERPKLAIPHIIAISLQYEKHNGANRRKRQIRQTGFVVEPEPEAGIELAHFSHRI